MNVKPKKCKGTGKAIGHGCGELQFERVYGLGKKCKCYQNWLLTSDAGKEQLSKITLKVTSPRLELEKAEKTLKDRKKLGFLLTNVKNICHEYIRLRDVNLPCISCGIPYNESFQAGHFAKAELYSNLKFDEKNINGQCQQCNLRKEGNESGYRAGLIQRYGKEHLDYIDERIMQYKRNNFEWERDLLIETREYYKQKLKHLKIKL
jgi:hypothetical protein